MHLRVRLTEASLNCKKLTSLELDLSNYSVIPKLKEYLILKYIFSYINKIFVFAIQELKAAYPCTF